jgi:hypothetical protein
VDDLVVRRPGGGRAIRLPRVDRVFEHTW